MGSLATAVAAASAGTGQLRILFVGDSYPEGEGASARANRYLDKLISLVRTRFSISGSGTGLTPANAYFTYLSDSSAWRSTHSGSASAPSFFGTQGDKGGQIAAGATGITFTITGDSFDLIYLQSGTGGGAGTLKVFIDGSSTAQTTINTASGTYAPGSIYHGSLGAAGSHTVKVTATTNPIMVDGIVAYNGDYTAGVTYWDDTHTGYSSNQFENVDAQQGHARFLPHLVLDELTGGNDFLQSTRTPAQMAASLTARITKYKALASNPTIVLYTLWDIIATAGTNGLGYTFAQYKTAAANAVAAATGDVHYLDLGATYPSVPSGWLASDSLHPSNTGHTQIAAALDSFLAALVPSSPSVSGSAAAVSTSFGAVGMLAAVSGQAPAVSNALGTVSARYAVSGTDDAVSGAIGSVTALVAASGTVVAVSTVSADVRGILAVGGRADAVSTAFGTVVLAGGLSVQGMASATSSATGQVTLLAAAAGQVAVLSAAFGSATIAVPGVDASGFVAAISGAFGSAAVISSTGPIVIPDGVIPIRELATAEVLYGARTTSFRYELLSHEPTTGLDTISGYLDGVQPGGSLTWNASASVKKALTLDVLGVPTAKPGLTRIADVNLNTVRIRPVLLIEHLPEIPLSVYIVTAAPEKWADTGRTYSLELHDKSSVLDQDKVDQTYTVAAGTVLLTALATVIASSGETITVDSSDTRTAAADMVWAAGTSKLKIANDLLGALAYNALWVDGVGNFRATPYIAPAERSIKYAILNDATGAAIVRELTDGENSIYEPNFTRDRDVFGVPNKVIAVQSGGGDATPATGVATNTDPASPYSYPSRGRWVAGDPLTVDVPDYNGPFKPIPDLITNSASFRSLASSATGWSDKAHTLGDNAVAAIAAVLALFPTLASALTAQTAAATLRTAAYASPQVETTIDNAAAAFETAATAVVVDGATVAPDAIVDFLNLKATQSLIASTAVQATVSLTCLPIPLELLDALRWSSTPAGIDARHTVQSMRFPLQFDGRMSIELQEVISL